MKVIPYCKTILLGFVILCLLTAISTNALACWEEESCPGSDGNESGSPNPNTDYAWHNEYGYGGYEYAYISVYADTIAYSDPCNEDLTATSNVWSTECKEKWVWNGDPESVGDTTFDCDWLENFDWEIEGDADNDDLFSDGTSEAEMSLIVGFASAPDESMDEHGFDFSSDTTKEEDSSWIPNVLELVWDLFEGDLDWDDTAFSSDNTFGDGPEDEEHAVNEPRSEGLTNDETYTTVWAEATLGGYAEATTLDDAKWAYVSGDASITNFTMELEE